MTDLKRVTVAGFQDEDLTWTEPVQVQCTSCTQAIMFSRDDGLPTVQAILRWSIDHNCDEHRAFLLKTQLEAIKETYTNE